MANVLTELNNHIFTITINRPDKLNALNQDTLKQLKGVVEEAAANNDVRVIIITGSGEKAFVAGADINELAKTNATSGMQFAQYGQQVFNTIENCGKPVIAAVNGFALGVVVN
jgi:Enoyl-CoA hydratase/carnithine racemase